MKKEMGERVPPDPALQKLVQALNGAFSSDRLRVLQGLGGGRHGFPHPPEREDEEAGWSGYAHAREQND